MKKKRRNQTLNQGKPALLPLIIGTGFGSGFWPWGPGTAGALLATLIWIGASYVFTPLWLLILTFVLILIFTPWGVWADNRLEPYWGEDPSRVVADEMVGVWIALLVAMPDVWWQPWVAFLLFRFFDIVKPLGIRRMEDLPGGVGVMMDDVLAGVYSAVILLAINFIIR